MLTIELIPATCLYSNVRSEIPKKEWDRIRKEVYKTAKNKCEVCNGDGKKQGYKHSVECHEIWEYDDQKMVQYLKGLIALCPRCHQVKHIGRTTVIGKQSQALEHLQKVNMWNHKQAVSYLAEIYLLQRWRSNFQWKLDITKLVTHFKLDENTIKNDRKII